MFRLRTNGLMWIGTNAERLASFSVPIQEGLEFYETDTGELYKLIQQSWVQINSSSPITNTGHFSATIYTDGNWNSESIPLWQSRKDGTTTITQVNATVVGSSTPTLTFNLEIRPYNTLSSVGTDVFSSDQVADEDSIEITTFATSTLTAKDFLVLTTPVSSAESGTVDILVVTVYYEE